MSTTWFKTVADLLASTASARGEGEQWFADSFQYLEAASDATDEHIETAGGVKLYVQPNDEGAISAKAFGVGLSGNTAAENATLLQAVLDFASEQQKEVIVSGVIRYDTPLVFKTNTRLRSNKTGFTTRLMPQDCAAFTVDGVNGSGGFAFEIKIDDITFDLSEVTNAQTYAALFKNCYRCHMSRVKFHNGVLSSTRFASLIKTEETCNHLIFQDVVAYGTGNTGAGNVVELRHSRGLVSFIAPDVENAYTGFFCGPNVNVDIYSPYMERLGQGFWFVPATSADRPHKVKISGGIIDIPATSSRAARFDGGTYSRGEIFVIDGLIWQTDNKATKNLMFATGSFTWSNNDKIVLRNLDWSWPVINAATQLVLDVADVSPYRFALHQPFVPADPPNPPDDHSVMWVSDGTGTGDAGDVLLKINAGGTTKTITLVDWSAV